jgi:Protein of unknown function (DUF3891)
VIVRTVHDGLELITQPDHAHLAHDIMAHCQPLANRPRRDAILLAIREHDNGWMEEDAAPAVDPTTGTIFDFVSAPLRVRHAVWPRGVQRLAATPWAAALVAQHAITVYDRFRSTAEWTPFFTEMTAARDTILREIAGSLAELASDYAFVRLADLISLTFCTGWTDEHRFADWTVRRSHARIIVRPDAFGGATIPFTIEARHLTTSVFRSDADLRRRFAAAKRTTLQGEVSSIE